MDPRRALVIAVVAGLAAVAVVATDTVYGVQARLETLRDGSWELVANTPSAYDTPSEMARPYGGGCATPTMRLTVENKKPIPDDVAVQVYWTDYAYASREGTIFKETWSLGAFESRTREFTVPPEAKPAPRTDTDPPIKPTGNVNVVIEDVDGAWFSPCVDFEEDSA